MRLSNEQFHSLCTSGFKVFQSRVPNPETRYKKWYYNAYGNKQRGSSGNMAFNASKLAFISPEKAKIYVDPRIAPYVPYTNERWIAKKWKGHKNPNEGWFERAAKAVVKAVEQRVKEMVK